MKTFASVLLALTTLLLIATAQAKQPGWKLVWQDNFNGPTFDTTNWSKIPRGKPEWAKYMSDNDACYDMRRGNLVLRGIVNPNRSATDTAEYITGGLYTKYKRPFHGGRLEIRAKLQGCTGAWPAIWLKPFEEAKFPWPSGGEIDIMERLNYDTIAYQTVHSNYTQHLGIRDNPRQGMTAPIKPNDYNVYAVEMHADSVVFFINDRRTFAYPKIETDKQGQFPFDKPYYLLIDMQLGGGWVGGIKRDDVPVEMIIDWVKYYKKD